MTKYEQQFYEVIISELPKIRKALDLLQKQNRAEIVKLIDERNLENIKLKKASAFDERLISKIADICNPKNKKS